MATIPLQVPASPGRIQRKPLAPSIETTSKVPYGQFDEQKENYHPRKPLPTIPIPPSGRIQGGPVSPVKINIQNEDWAPRPSSATIEGHRPTHQATTGVTEQSGREPHSSGAPRARLESSPQRLPPTYNSGRFPEAQSAIFVDSPPASVTQERDDLLHAASAVNLQQASEDPTPEPLQYHHQSTLSQDNVYQTTENSSPAAYGQTVNRHLTPTSQSGRGSVLPRPTSTYSAFSGDLSRGRSPGHMPGSPSYGGARGRSDSRPLSYVDLLNTSYAQQQAPTPISFDNSDLRNVVGTNASLLSTQKTLEMYRLNVKKTTDPSIQYAFALFLITAAQEAGLNDFIPERKNSPKPPKSDRGSPYLEEAPSSGPDLLREARQILMKLADRSYPFAQYYLADGFASGLFNKGKPDNDRAFPLFVAASKHGHAESGYRAALCYEFGWGCRKDAAKAVQFYRQSASKNHPGAMTRLGRACLSGELGLNKYREGLKWLRRATESADIQYNAAPYHLGILYESGYGDDIFQDETYAAQLFTQAADLGHVEASYRLGEAYEHGRLSCPKDPALSVHFYTGAAQRGNASAMMALCAWYMVGAEPVLEKDENEAYEWAKRAAESGLTKAEYAVGYFTEMGIGCRRDPLEANVWYVRAAEAGDERAKHRLAAIRAAIAGGDPMIVAAQKNTTPSRDGKANPAPKTGKMMKRDSRMPIGAGVGGDSAADLEQARQLQNGGKKDEKECIVM